MKVQDFLELYGISISEQRFEIYLNQNLICCGFISSVPDEIEDDLLNATITRFYPTVNDMVFFDAEI